MHVPPACSAQKRQSKIWIKEKSRRASAEAINATSFNEVLQFDKVSSTQRSLIKKSERFIRNKNRLKKRLILAMMPTNYF